MTVAPSTDTSGFPHRALYPDEKFDSMIGQATYLHTKFNATKS